MPEPKNPEIAARFRRQRRRDTKPELRLRSALHRRGLRFRVDRSPIEGMRSRADIVFGPPRIAVFVDGCFWHSCPEHSTIPKNNREWWTGKLAANQERDERVSAALRQAGWEVVRVWEHEDMEVAAKRIESLVRSRRP